MQKRWVCLKHAVGGQQQASLDCVGLNAASICVCDVHATDVLMHNLKGSKRISAQGFGGLKLNKKQSAHPF
jgi:hypothetical protein